MEALSPGEEGSRFVGPVGPVVYVMVWTAFAGPLSIVVAIRSNPGDRKPGWRVLLLLNAQHRFISFWPYSLNGGLLCPVTPVRSGWTRRYG